VTVYQASESEFSSWLSGLTGKDVYVPAATKLNAWVRRLEGDEHPAPALGRARAAQSGKGFLLPPAETVARYGQGAQATALAERPVVAVGVRACELRAWKYLDHVMLEGEFVDPLYEARRRNTAIVSCDCVECAESCCCVLVDGRPYVEAGDGADINVIAMDGAILVEPLSDRGQELLSAGGANWREAGPEQLAKRDSLRQAMVDRLKQQNADFTVTATDDKPPLLPEGDDEAWQSHAADCVECGACTHICPTCHCFYLFDHEVAADSTERVRNWDSCLLSTYHRMAGGVNMKLSPRPELRSRLANRILHKFVYSPQQYGMLGCVGCGRCIEACPGAIDIRKVVEDLKK